MNFHNRRLAALSGLTSGLFLLCYLLPVRAAESVPLERIKAPQSSEPAVQDNSNIPAASIRSMKRIPVAGPGISLDKPLLPQIFSGNELTEDSFQLQALPENRLVPVGKDRLPPVLLEANYTEGITLRRALEMARQNNLAIKISQTDWAAGRYKYYGSFGRFLPVLSMDVMRTSNTSGSKTIRSTPGYITVLYPVFLGGASVFNLLQNQHEMKAAQYATSASINDVLLNVYLKYYDLLLNSALLQIRSKAVEVSQAQLSINRDLKTAGLGTDFEVMQSSTLLALDRQRLVRQEVTTRRAALQLAVALNTSVIQNLAPAETAINRGELVDSSIKPQILTALAVENRPELARFEQLRLAARRAAGLATSSLMPQAAFFTNNTLNIGGGSNSIIIPTGGAANTGGVTSGTGGGGSANSAFSSGFILNWMLAGAGVENAGNIAAANMKARRAWLESQEALLKISAEVREAYLDTRASETDIDVTSEAVRTATEEVRMADLRLRHQIGTNLELIQAQKDYVEALSRRVEAFVNYKQSQARLLHAIGLISIESLTSDHAQHFDLHRGGKGR
jgi:outer membrane protein TolC